jgi:hypothetical protein
VLAWAFATDIDHLWFIWVLVPWGIGLFTHFIMVVIFSGRYMKIKEEGKGQGDSKKGFYCHLALYIIANIRIFSFGRVDCKKKKKKNT